MQYLDSSIFMPQRFYQPENVSAIMEDSKEWNQDPLIPGYQLWNPLALSDGYPSLLLYFSTLQSLNLLENDEVIHLYVLKIKEEIEKKGLMKNLSLFSGVTGICFALQSASMNGTRYKRFLNTMQNHLIERVKTEYIQKIKENVQFNRPSPSTFCDLIQGLPGIGRYTLENSFDSRFEKLTIEIIKTLLLYIQPLSIDDSQVPGWYLSPNDILNQNIQPQPKKGNFNLGLAHGIPGVLAFLSIAYLRGMIIEGQKEAIEKMAYWVLDKAFIENKTLRWPHNVGWDEEVFQVQPNEKRGCRDAWCYGAPGVSRSLYLAGKAISHDKLKTQAMEAYSDIFSRSRKEWSLPGPGICHGVAGLLLITNAMANEMREQILQEHTLFLSKILIEYFNPDYPFGFKDVEACRDGSSVELSKPGLLEGAVGAYLTLITIERSSTNWHLPFLIHE